MVAGLYDDWVAYQAQMRRQRKEAENKAERARRTTGNADLGIHHRSYLGRYLRFSLLVVFYLNVVLNLVTVHAWRV